MHGYPFCLQMLTKQVAKLPQMGPVLLILKPFLGATEGLAEIRARGVNRLAAEIYAPRLSADFKRAEGQPEIARIGRRTKNAVNFNRYLHFPLPSHAVGQIEPQLEAVFADACGR